MTDRFRLKYHHETRELATYAMRVASDGPGLGATEYDCPNPAPPGSEPCPMVHLDPSRGEMTARGVPMQALVTAFSMVTGRMVQNKTELFGMFDAKLQWPPDESGSFVKAVRQQLGLELEESRGPVGMLIIDSIERAPGI